MIITAVHAARQNDGMRFALLSVSRNGSIRLLWNLVLVTTNRLGQFTPATERKASVAKLYPRQRELVKLLISGLILKEAAYRMGITDGAAKSYAMRARKRLGCRTTWQLMYELGRERT